MIPYGRQSLSDDDVLAVTSVLRGEWLTTGPHVEEFEASLQEVIGGVPAVAVSSGTAALHAAYAGAGLGPGDEVITPPITFVATQAALLHVGATPVFADVQRETANLDPGSVVSKIGPRTSAIVAVDYAGHPAEMTELRRIADRHKLLLIEDAAHSLGAMYREQPVGTLADLTTFSFFPTKNITTGEGGAVASPHKEILDRVRTFSRQGLVRDPRQFWIRDQGPWHQEVQSIGLNYRMSDIHAALGTSQLKRLAHFRARRREIKQRYDNALDQVALAEIPSQFPWVRPMWHLYPLRVAAESRMMVFTHLRSRGVGVQVNYLPAYRHPALSQFGDPADYPESEDFYARELSLPLHVNLSDEQVHFVIGQVIDALAR